MDMFELPKWIVPVRKLVKTERAGAWCKLPYYNHPKGCPNYGKKSYCPPNAPSLEEYFDLEKELYLVHSEFNLAEHEHKMKEKHPNWSRHQCRCVLYWQSRSRKQMKERVERAVKFLSANRITACPEGMGMNVFATARHSGLLLERTRDIEICRHVSLIGYK